MISTFDLSRLKLLLKDFYHMTRIRITVFDDSFHELAAWPELPAPFCRIIRTDADAAACCCRCDKRACETAAKHRTLYTYRCHAGLTESITPIIVGNITIGYLLFGHVFSYSSHDEGWRQIRELCRNYRLDFASLETACRLLPVITEDYIASASHIMQAVASCLCMERMVTLRRQELPVQIDEYIQAHFTEKLDTARLAEQFGIGRTRLYKIAKQSYGLGIAEHIRNLRMEKARKLLTEQSGLTLSQIASECGFDDYNYFITVFKRVVGMPPKAYAQFTKHSGNR